MADLDQDRGITDSEKELITMALKRIRDQAHSLITALNAPAAKPQVVEVPVGDSARG